jgi:F-type H+-transporting ATPase subunit epsilon
MSDALMHLKILLPYEIFADASGVRRIVVETTEGSMGLLPHRLDCVAILVPGILSYQGDGEVAYVAVDAGVLVKTGVDVSISARNAVAGNRLSDLRAQVADHFLQLDEAERQTRSALAKIESGFIRRLREIQHDR